MFYKGEFYKHIDGRDAIMEVVQITHTDDGYEIEAFWRTLDYHGNAYGPVTDHYGRPVTYYHTITFEEAKFWRPYEAQ